MHPYRSIRVVFDNSDYDNVCEAYGGGSDRERLAAWRDLGDLLAHRVGWHFDLDLVSRRPDWCLGVLGEARLVIGVADQGYSCYDHARDESVICETIADVTDWLDECEENASGPSDTLRALGEADDWAVFRSYRYELRVSWSDGRFAAIMPGLNDVSFGATLAEALGAAAEMICHVFGAPVALALELTLLAELDETATAQLRR